MVKSSRKKAGDKAKATPRKGGSESKDVSLPGMKGFMVLPHALSKRMTGEHDDNGGMAAAAAAAARYMFYKAHVMKASEDAEADGPQPHRTLFVCNIPRAFSFDDVASVFSCFGQVEQVLLRGANPMANVFVPFSQQSLEEAGAGGAAAQRDAPAQSAYVVYESRESVRKAMQTDMRGSCQPYTEGSGVAGGMRRWIEEYKSHRPDPSRLQEQVDRFMEAFDRRTEMQRRAAAAGPVTDEDGFTLVTRRSRQRTKTTEATVLVRHKQQKKRKADKELLDFYRFQRREKKREELAVLRRKFEEDKKRIAVMKEQRRFKPF